MATKSVKSKGKKKAVGRPSKYTKKLGNSICQRISDGESLRAICRDDKMPVTSTVHLWVLDNKEFSEQYEKARIMQANHMFEELLEIADDGSNDWMEKEDPDNPGYAFNGEHIQRSRLRVDTRKWFLSKVAPKIYGDKLELGGDKENPLLFGFVKTVYDEADSLEKRPKK